MSPAARSCRRTIADQINDRTDGVPLFIEELTKAVVESGLLANDRHETMDPVTPLAIPTSLQESLLARLDRLAPTTDVVQIAAALGRQFSHELISAVAALPLQKLDDALAQLVKAELIFRRGVPPDAEYTFKHALVQDTAYGTMLRARRQQIHARIADTLEDQIPDIVAAQPALLARHCSEAGLSEKAVVYWLKAGQQSLSHSAMTEAAAQLRKGLDALDGLPDEPWAQATGARSATRAWARTDGDQGLFGARGRPDLRARAHAGRASRTDQSTRISPRVVLRPMDFSPGPGRAQCWR